MTKSNKTENTTTEAKTAVTEDHQQTHQATVTIVAGAEFEGGFTEVAVTVFKYAPKLFVAFMDGKEYHSDKSVTEVLATIATMANGTILKSGAKGFTHDKVEWASTSNEPTEKVLSDADKAALDTLAADISTALDGVKAGKDALRIATFRIADDLAKASAILATEGNEQVSAKAFASWQRMNLPMTLKGKNAVSEHMAIAEMPVDLRECLPLSKASAKSMGNWRTGLRKRVTVALVERYMAAVTDSQRQRMAGCDSAQTAYDILLNDAKWLKSMESVVAKALGKAVEGGESEREAGVMSSFDADTQKFDEAKEEGRIENVAVGAMCSYYPAAFFVESAAFAKGMRAECDALRAANSDAAKDAAKTEAAAGEVARAFPDFTFGEAVEHIAKIVGVRDDWEEVLTAAIDKVAEMLDAAESAATEADEATEEQDKEDVGT